MKVHPDDLRTPETVCKPDIRSPKTSFPSNHPLTIEYQHSVISDISLHKGVPEDIRVQLETTKNLYLYAWYVYRFYPVVKLHAYACLELALRERFETELLTSRTNKRKPKPKPMLGELLTYAVKSGHLKNENFSVWRHRTVQRAQNRTEEELWKEAQQNGLNEIIIDDTQYEIKDVDRDHEYLEVILKTLPWFRNHYAHGSSSLDNQAIGTVKLVAEIINQIYEE